MPSVLNQQNRRHSLFLLIEVQSYLMSTILSITAIITFLSMAGLQMFKNHRASGHVNPEAMIMPPLLGSLSVMILCGLLSGSSHHMRLLLDGIISAGASSALLLSVRPSGKMPLHIGPVPILIPMLSIYYLACASGFLCVPSPSCLLVLASLSVLYFSGQFMTMIWKRIRNVKAVMKSGNVWSFVTLCVDFMYVIPLVVIILLVHSIFVLYPSMPEIPVAAAVLLLLLEVVAVAVRISFDSSFVIMHDHERVIVESMRISHMESHASSNPKVDSQYKDLYERIEAYFEMAKPYLDGSLTINDIVKVVYSNKVYISKAICHYTGRNFRQFVNYYRVMYSMDHFRANPELKVSELAERCGFNTVVSYTMAFRLFMNETPSEWCRKERAKILKTKK